MLASRKVCPSGWVDGIQVELSPQLVPVTPKSLNLFSLSLCSLTHTPRTSCERRAHENTWWTVQRCWAEESGLEGGTGPGQLRPGEQVDASPGLWGLCLICKRKGLDQPTAATLLSAVGLHCSEGMRPNKHCSCLGGAVPYRAGGAAEVVGPLCHSDQGSLPSSLGFIKKAACANSQRHVSPHHNLRSQPSLLPFRPPTCMADLRTDSIALCPLWVSRA